MKRFLLYLKYTFSSACLRNALCIFVFAFLGVVENGFGQTATNGDYRTRSAAALNWSGTTTWQVRSGGNWANTTTAPSSSANVYIQAGSTITIDVATATCNDLHINTTGVLTINGNTIQVNGKLRAYTGTAVFTTGADGAFYSGQTSTISPGASSITSSGAGKLSFVGNSRTVFNTGEWGSATTGYTQDFSLTAGQTATGAVGAKAAVWTITSGTFDAGANTISADNGASGGDITIALGATLISARTGAGTAVFQRTGNTLGGTLTVNGTLELSGTSPAIAMTTVNLNGTVNYSKAATQNLGTVPNGTSQGGAATLSTYNNLILGGTSAKTLLINITVNGTLSMQGTTTSLALSTFTLTYGASSTLEYAGSAQQTTTASEFPSSIVNLIINNANGVLLAANRTITGTLTLTAGVFNLQGKDIDLFGNASRTAGSVTAATGSTFTYDQQSNGQTVIDGTYNNLTLSGFDKVLPSTGIVIISTAFNPTTANGHTITGSTINFNGASQSIPAFFYNNLDLTGASGTLSFGNVRVAGVFTPASVSTATNGTINFNGTGSQSIPAFNYNNLTISGARTSATVTLPNGTIGITNTFNPSATGVTYTITGNTFNFKGATQTIPAFNYNNLDLTTATGTLFVNGTVGIAGTYTPASIASSSTGTIDFNSTGAQTIPAFNYNNLTISGSRTSNNVTFSSSGTVGIAGAISLTATFSTGTFVLTGSTIDYNGTGAQTVLGTAPLSYNNLTISGARTSNSVTLSNALVTDISGTFSPIATFTSGNYIVTGNTVNFNGSSAQSIPAFTFNNLQLSNSAGATLTGSPTVNGSLTISSGNLTTSTNTITLGASATLTEGASQTVVGNITTTRTVSGTANTFGGLGLTITPGATAPGSTAVTRVTGTAISANGHASIKRYFDITPTINTGLNATLAFTYNTNGELNGETAANLKLWKSPNPFTTYTKQGGTVSSNTITLSGINDFSRWTASDQVLGAPTITNFTTPVCAGSTITIDGTNLDGATSVTIGGTSVTTVLTNTTTQITATVGSGTTGLVSVTNPGGTATTVTNCTVNANSTPTVSIASNPAATSGALTICSGTSVTFTATAGSLGGGSVSNYNFKNGSTSLQSSTSNTYTTTTLANGNNITCDITVTGGTCLTSTTASSNAIAMTVNANSTPTVSIASNPAATSGSLTICSGTSVTFTATPGSLAGGSVSNYNFKNGSTSLQSSTSNAYTTTTLANGNNITCDITVTGGTCLTSTTASSNAIAMTVNANSTPTVSIASNPAATSGALTICSGTSVIFTATAGSLGGGSVSNYNFKNGSTSLQSGTSNTYSTTTLANGDNITCDITVTGGTCLTSATASSNAISITVNLHPTPVAQNTGPVCSGNDVTLSLLPPSYSSYSWTGPLSFTSSSATPVISNAITLNGGVYHVTVTDGNGCQATAMTTVQVDTVIVTFTGIPSAICFGSDIPLSATVNSGVTSYLWGNGGGAGTFDDENLLNTVYHPDITELGGLLFTLTVSGNSCPATDFTVNVDIYDPPTVDLGPDVTGCLTETNIIVNNGNGNIASWSGGISGHYTFPNSPDLNELDYYVDITDFPPVTLTATSAANGACPAQVGTVTITNIYPEPIATASSNTPFCDGTDIHLLGSASGGQSPYNFNWDATNGYSSPLQNPVLMNASPSDNGTYNLTVIDNNGCHGFDAIDVTVTNECTADFRSIANGNWSDPAIWEYNNGSAWASATQAPGPDNNVLIQAAHAVVTGNIIINGGKVIVDQGALVCGTGVISGAGSVLVNSVLKTSNPDGLSGSSSTTIANGVSLTLGSSSTVEYNGTATQTITNALDYANLTCSNLNIQRLGGDILVHGDITIGAGTLDVSPSNYSIEVDGNWTNNGTFIPGSGTVTFNGTNDATVEATPAAETFNNVTVMKAAGKNITMKGQKVLQNLVIGGGTVIAFTGNTLSISGDMTVNTGGSFDPGTGTVSFVGIGNSTIGGSATPYTFHNLVGLKSYNPAKIYLVGDATIFNDAIYQHGAVDATAGGSSINILVGGSWTMDATASFDPGTSTVTFNGTGIQTIGGTAPSQTFYDMVLAGSGSMVISPTIGIALHKYKMQSGFVNASQTGTPKIILVGGNWENNGGTFDGTGRIIQFSGSTPQTVGGSQSTTFDKLTVNNPTGILFDTRDEDCDGILTLTSGVITTGSNKLILGSAGDVVRTSGHVNGTFRKYLVPGTTHKTFEVGGATAAEYRPFDVDYTTPGSTGTGFLDVISSVLSSGPPAASGLSTSRSANVSFTVTNTGTGASGTLGVTTHFLSSDVPLGNPNNFIIAKLDGSTWTYPSMSAHTFTSASCVDITDFSTFYTGELSCNSGEWTGYTSTDWNDASNWCDLSVPTSATNVVIPAGTPHTVSVTGVDHCGNMTIATGAVVNVSSAGTLSVSGNWTNNGTFNPGSGTVTFDGSSTSTIGGTTSPQTFYNLTTIANVQALDALQLGNDLTITSGTFDAGSNNVTISGKWKVISSLGSVVFVGTWSVAGDLTNNGTITADPSSTLNFNSSSAQAWTDATGMVSNYGNVIISNGAIVNAGSSSIYMTGNWTCNGTFNPGTSSVYMYSTTGTSQAIGGSANPQTFYNFTTRCEGCGNPWLGDISAVAGKTISVLGNLSITDGSAFTPSVALNCAGDFTISSGGTYAGAGSTLVFNGSGTQHWTDNTTTPQNYGNINIDKPSGLAQSLPSLKTDPYTGADLTVTSGTLDMNGNKLYLFGGMLLSGGTLTAGSEITVGGNWTNNGGTFNPGTGTVMFNGTGATQTIGGTASFQQFSTLISSTINLHDDAQLLGLRNLFIPSGTLTVGNTYELDITGNFNNDGTFTHGNGTVKFNGTTPQTLGGSHPITFHNLTLNNTSGLSVTDPNDYNCDGAVGLISGVFTTGANKALIVDNGGSVVRTAGHVNGKLQKFVPVASSVAVTFEIGDATNYTPVDLAITGATGENVIAYTTAGDHSQIGSSSINPAKSVNRSWQLSGLVTFSNFDATFHFDPSDVDATADPNNFYVAKVDAAGTWTTQTTGTRTATSTQAVNMLSECGFILGELSCPPGEWTGATSDDWNTASNWCSGTVPTATTNVVIPAATLHTVRITAQDACGNINIENGAVVTMTGTGSLSVNGNWENDGTFVPGTGTVSFDGSGTSTVSGTPTQQDFWDLIDSKTGGGGVAIGGSIATLNVNTITLTSGTLDAGTATQINVSGDWTNNGGIFIPGTGTVSFTGGSNSTIGGSSATQTFNNVSVNKTSTNIELVVVIALLDIKAMVIQTGTLNTNANDSIDVSGDWTVNSGGVFNPTHGSVNFVGTSNGTIGGNASEFDFNECKIRRVTVELYMENLVAKFNGRLWLQGGTVHATGSTIHLRSDLTNDGATLVAGTSTVLFDGSAAQVLDGVVSTTFHNLSIDNTSGLSITGADVDMDGAMDFVHGKIILNPGNITLESTSTITGAGPTTYFVTVGYSYAKRAAIADNQRKDIPIGTVSEYTPVGVQLSTASTPDYIRARVINGAYPGYDSNEDPVGAIEPRSILKTYFVTGDIPTQDDITLTVQWNTADEPATGFDRQHCGVAHWIQPSWDKGYIASAATDLGGGTYSQSRSGITSWSPFAVFSQSITCTVPPSPYCAGDNITVNYIADGGTWNSGNVFTAQLSDASGSFASPTNIGTVISQVSGSISATIPSTTTSGTGYRIRVVSDDPAGDGDDNGSDLTINPQATQPAAFTTSSATVCQGQTGVIYTVPNDPTVTYNWSYTGTGATINGTSNSVTVDFSSSATSGTLQVTATNSCGTSAARTISITVNPGPACQNGGTVNASCGCNCPPGFTGVLCEIASGCTPPSLPSADNDGPKCSGSDINLSSSSNGSTPFIYQWSGPDGFSSTDQNPLISPAYTIASGTYTVTITNACGSTTSTTDVLVDTLSVSIDQGSTAILCGNASLDLTATTYGTSTPTILWTTSNGGGLFTPDNDSITEYAADFSDITNSPITLTITLSDPSNTCPSAQGNILVTVNSYPTAIAQSNSPVCEGDTIHLISFASGGTVPYTFNWDGPGGFVSSQQDTVIANSTTGNAGPYNLTVGDANGCYGFDVATVTVNTCGCSNPVIVDAGPDIHTCVNGDVNLSGSITGAVTTGNWTGGLGIFTPGRSDLNAVYAPDLSEAGTTVVLYLVSDDPGGSCTADSDAINISVDDFISIDAGPDIHTCISGQVGLSGIIAGGASTGYWTGGLGTFDPDSTDLNATYTPDPSEAGTTVTLYLNPNVGSNVCPFDADSINIQIDALPIIDAGADDQVCYNGSVQLNGSVSGGATIGHWSGGQGAFSPDNNTLNAFYSPAPSESGTIVQLYLVSDNPSSVCNPDSDLVEITVDTIYVDAGPDIHSCVSGDVNLSGVIVGGVSTGHWYGGQGSFSNTTDLNAIYTPVLGEAGTIVTLYLASDASMGCQAVTDSINITIDATYSIDAGPDIHTCISGEVDLSGIISGGATTGYWQGGLGSFSDTTDLNAVYTPDPSEAGTIVTLYLYPDAGTNVCPLEFDSIKITIDTIPSANAGMDQAICSNSSATLSGYVYGGVSTGYWSTSGDGTFNDTTLLNAIYTPGPNDISSGSVILTLTPDTAGVCPVQSDEVMIFFNLAPSPSISGPNPVCEFSTGNIYTTQALQSNYIWNVTGGSVASGGSLTDNNITITWGATGTGHVTVNYTDIHGCTAATAYDYSVTIDEQPVVSDQPNQTLCNTPTFTMTQSAPSVGTGTWTLISGTATITTPGSPTTTVTGVVAGTSATVRWTVTNGTCSAFDEVTVTNDEQPVVSDQPNQTLCNTPTFTMTQSAPSVGTGTWTLISGTATITTPGSPTTTVTGVVAGTSATVRWTVTNGTCSAFDEVTVTNDEQPVVSDQPNQTLCNTPTFTMTQSAPSVGTGTWTLISGTATITTPGSPTTTVTGVVAGTSATVRWTVTNGTCSAFDEVTVTNDEQPVVSDQPNQTLCNTPTFTMTQSAPSVGTGTWTLISGTATITTPGSPTTTVTGVVAGTSATVRWTVTNGTCSAFDEVTVTNDEQPVVSDQPNQTLCNTPTFTMTQSAPSVGTGTWTLISGTATITTPGSPTTTVTGVVAGTSATVRWTVTNGTCSAFDEVTVTNDEQPVVSDQPNQTLCNTPTFTMTQSAPSVGTGTWTLISGTATITTPGSPTTTVTGVVAGTSATVRWTVTNGTCSAFDEVTVTNDEQPVVSDQPNQTLCNTPTFTMTQSAPSVGTGTWTLISGTATITTPGSPTTTVTGVVAGTSATVRWTVTNGTCSAFDEVTVTNDEQPVVSDQPNQTLCNTPTFTMTQSAPSVGTGTWTLISGTATITTPGSPTTTVTGVVAGTSATVRWTVTNGTCSAFDEVTVTNDEQPVVSDQPNQTLCNTPTFTMTQSAPSVGTGTWTLISGTATITTPGSPTTTVTGVVAGTSATVRWTVTNGTCSAFDEVTVTNDNCTSTATLHMTMFIQGYYQDSTSATPMDNFGNGGCLFVTGYSPNMTDADSVVVSLMDSVTQTFVESDTGILQTNGALTVTFSNSVIGNRYYLKVTHRNAIETWSKYTVLMSSNTFYDFTTGADKAYLDNQVEVKSGVWAFWSGDVYDSNNSLNCAQDGVIESGDYGLVEFDYQNFLTGYQCTDVTGDGVVESADYGLIETNYQLFISSQHPF